MKVKTAKIDVLKKTAIVVDEEWTPPSPPVEAPTVDLVEVKKVIEKARQEGWFA